MEKINDLKTPTVSTTFEGFKTIKEDMDTIYFNLYLVVVWSSSTASHFYMEANSKYDVAKYVSTTLNNIPILNIIKLKGI